MNLVDFTKLLKLLGAGEGGKVDLFFAVYREIIFLNTSPSKQLIFSDCSVVYKGEFRFGLKHKDCYFAELYSSQQGRAEYAFERVNYAANNSRMKHRFVRT